MIEAAFQGAQWWDIAGAISSVITIFGLPLALWRIRRTRQSVDATRLAVLTTERRLAHFQILTLLPQLRSIQDDLDRGVETADRDLIRASLVSWKTLANRMRGLLIANQTSGELGELLQVSATLSTEAKMELMESKKTSPVALRELTRPARSAIEQVTDMSGTLEAQLAIRAPEGDDSDG